MSRLAVARLSGRHGSRAALPGAPTLNRRIPTSAYLVALTALIAISRAPQLDSPNLLLDGDEGVLGLMARHAVHGRELPLFFWGQHYGLSLVETVMGALSFALFGTGALPLKVAMLALWTAGIWFLFLALSAIVGARRGFLCTCVLLLHPAWAVWSMKARGGYVTAFTLTAALLWLVVPRKTPDSVVRWAAAGALSGLIYLAQPLWLPGVAPIVLVMLWGRRRSTAPIAYASAAAVVVIAVKLATPVASEAWSGPALWNPDIWGMRIRLVQQVYLNLTGAYYLSWALDPPGPITRLLSLGWSAAIPVLFVAQIYRVTTRRYSRWSHLFAIGAGATLASTWVLLFARDARYLLPLSGLVVPLAGVEFADLVDRRLISRGVASSVTAVVLLLGLISMWEFREFNFLWKNPPGSWSEARRMHQVINALGSRGVRHVFAMNGLLDTQLIFYSDEQIISRSASLEERYPPYVVEVNRALATGEPVAVVGYTDTSGAPGCWDVPICTGGIAHLVGNPEAIFTVDGKYFVYVGATKALLGALHFDFPD